MELLLTVIVLHSLSLCQGIEGAVTSSNGNKTSTISSDETMVNKTGPYRPSLSQTCYGTLGVDDQGKWVAVNLKSSSPQVERKIMDQICKELGCGGLYNIRENNSAPTNTCLTDCTAMNSTLYNCTAAAQGDCSSTIEILCEWQIVRLINGKDRCAGRVELLDSGLWGSVCDDEWDFKASKVVCRQLGCGTPLIITVNNSRFGQGTGPIHISKMNCTGAEKNLWQCSTHTQMANYCGHKEDAGVVCSESMDKPVTTMQTITLNQTNWTTESVTTAFEDTSSGLSASVLGCIVLSVALLFALFLIAAQCIYYKTKNMHALCMIHQSQLMMATTMVQTSTENRRTSNEDQSDTSSEDSKHYIFPLATENAHSGTQMIRKPQDDQCRTSTGSSGHNTTPFTMNNIKHDQDSGSTSSEECYENTNDEEQNFFNPAVSQVYPVPSTDLQTAASYHTKEAVNGKSIDSASTSSDECYENTGPDAESFVQTLKENSSHPVQPLLSHANPLITESASLPRDQDESSTSSEEAYENPPDADDVYDMPPDQTSSDGDYDDVANW